MSAIVSARAAMLPPVDFDADWSGKPLLRDSYPKNVSAVLTRRLLYFALFPRQSRSFMSVKLYVVKKSFLLANPPKVERAAHS
jgi:hypothetical protein